MGIAEIRTHRVTAPLHTPFVTALRRATAVESLLVELVDEDGRSGFGEAPQVWQVTGASIAGSEACVAEQPHTARRRPGRPGRDGPAGAAGGRRQRGGQGGRRYGLHDLAARRLGVPLVRLLGGTALRVSTDVTLSAGPAEELTAAATDRVAEGFTVLKVKVGTDAEADIHRVRAIRAAVGEDVTIRLDANQGWTPRAAVRVIRALEDERIELVEQPVPGKDLEGLAWVSDRVETPILADESVFSVRDLVEVIRRRAADLVNVKLARCSAGRARRARPRPAWLALAEEHGVGTLVGSMMEGPVGVGAAASLVAACGTTAVSDLDAAWWLASSPVTGGPRYQGAAVILPSDPGLGVTGVRLN